MYHTNRPALSKATHLAKRLAQPFSKQRLLHAARVMGPTLFALVFASAAHAQGTMDFTGATTLMTTFKTSAIDVSKPNRLSDLGGLSSRSTPEVEFEGFGIAL